MSSENREMSPHPLERLVPPLNIARSPKSIRDHAQNLGYVVVFLDELFADTEVLSGAQHRLFEVVVFEQPHFACHSLAWRSERRRPKSNRLNGLRLRLRRSSRAGGICSSWPSAPSIARTRGGSAIAALARRL